MDNPEKLETLGTQDTGRRHTKQINVRVNQRGNQEWTIQRNWHQMGTQDEDKCVLDTTTLKCNYEK
jgi:hypothetical protein